MRERRPGVWEIRVVVANDEVTGRSVQRSFTVHGDSDVANARRRDCSSGSAQHLDELLAN